MAKQNKAKQQNSLRIIAGRWRGRKLTFANVEGLRPTPDRIRETVFNWLQPVIGQSHCLDLFSGSGALGFEAASRGAQSVTMVELNNPAAKLLLAHCQQLSADNCTVVNSSADQFVANTSMQYDIVFIDPPYSANLWTEITQQLVSKMVLANGAHIYIECPSDAELPLLPSEWTLIKDKKAGAVRYCLFLND